MTGEEVSNEELAKLEEELKKLEDKDTGYGSPSASQKDNLFKFFRHILITKDTTRIGNLTAQELGISNLSIRGWKRIAHYAKAENLEIIEDYFNEEAEIMTSTSMSKKGFWSQLFVTQIKAEKKIKETKEKKSLFGKKPEEGA